MAVGAARADAGVVGYFPLEAPCTVDVRQKASLVHRNRFLMPY